jgi:hypothetical protein
MLHRLSTGTDTSRVHLGPDGGLDATIGSGWPVPTPPRPTMRPHASRGSLPHPRLSGARRLRQMDGGADLTGHATQWRSIAWRGLHLNAARNRRSLGAAGAQEQPMRVCFDGEVVLATLPSQQKTHMPAGVRSRREVRGRRFRHDRACVASRPSYASDHRRESHRWLRRRTGVAAVFDPCRRLPELEQFDHPRPNAFVG